MLNTSRTVLDPLVYKGMEVVSLDENTGEAILSVEVIEDMINPNGVVHGGITFILADFCAGMGCYALGYKVATMQASINYLKAVVGGKMTAKNTVLHHGKRSIICKVDIFDSGNNLVLSGNFTMSVLEPIKENILDKNEQAM